MASEALFLELAKALGQPSKAYRAFQSGIEIPFQAMKGYETGAEFADRVRQRRAAQQSLSDALNGTNVPDLQGLENLPGEQVRQFAPLAHFQRRPIAPIAPEKPVTMLPLYNRMGKQIGEVPSNAKFGGETEHRANPQFVGTDNGQGVIYDPDNTEQPFRTVPLPNGMTTLGPKVAPTLPSASLEKTSGEGELLRLLSDIKTNYDPSFVGMFDSRMTGVQQATGFGATAKASDFRRSVADLRDSVARERSGAAIGERNEWDRLLQIIPDDTKSDPDFLAKIPAFEGKLKSILSKRQTAYSQAGYRNSSGAIAPNSDNKSSAFENAPVPSFNTPEEAEASGHKGPAMIGGRRAVIH